MYQKQSEAAAQALNDRDWLPSDLDPLKGPVSVERFSAPAMDPSTPGAILDMFHTHRTHVLHDHGDHATNIVIDPNLPAVVKEQNISTRSRFRDRKGAIELPDGITSVHREVEESSRSTALKEDTCVIGCEERAAFDDEYSVEPVGDDEKEPIHGSPQVSNRTEVMLTALLGPSLETSTKAWA